MDHRPSTIDHGPSTTIRLASPADGDEVAAIYAPYCEGSATSFELAAPSGEEMAQRIAAIGAERPWLVLEVGDAARQAEARSRPRERRLAGYAYAAPHHQRAAYQWAVSTAIYVDRVNHRRGVGRALYTTLFEVLRHLGYFRATAGITLPNAASVGLHEAFGFTLVGVYRDIGFKLGAWRDVAWYEADVQPLVAEPVAPRSISSLSGTPEWDASVAKGLALYVHR
jgi:phosphinothricin acetyltransferase